MKYKQVLIVEDDSDIIEILQIHLKDLFCETVSANDGMKGLELALNESFDLIILDVMLPLKDGIEICREVRANNIFTPVIMLTAKSDEIDKVVGLETGADDYMTKPFGIREFISRVKAQFRRQEMIQKPTQLIPEEEILTFGSLNIDKAKRKVKVEGKAVDLTPKEFDLLLLFASQPGRSFSREELLSTIWGYEFNGFEHTVNSHINRLRSKIEPNINQPAYILTTWGVGYRFNDELI